MSSTAVIAMMPKLPLPTSSTDGSIMYKKGVAITEASAETMISVPTPPSLK
jgi:hypothetical protein